GDRLAGDHPGRPERGAAVERAVEKDGVGRVVVPGQVDLPLRAGGDAGADGVTGTVWVVRPRRGERLPAVAGARHAHAAAAGRAADGGVPGDVDVVAEGAAGVGVGSDHRLVVEVVGSAGGGE